MQTCKSAVILYGMLFSVVVAGCATTDQKLSRQYQPVVNATGGSGELYLAVTDAEPMALSRGNKPRMRLSVSGEKPKARSRGGKPALRKGATAKYVVVTVKNDSGKKLGIIVSSLASDELLRDALREELNAAGYTVRQVNTLPEDAAKGISLSRVYVDAEQVTGLLEVEGTCKVSVSLDLWRNGARVRRLDYVSSYSDSAITDRDQLLQATLQKALQDVMRQAIPEVINTLGD